MSVVLPRHRYRRPSPPFSSSASSPYRKQFISPTIADLLHSLLVVLTIFPRRSYRAVQFSAVLFMFLSRQGRPRYRRQPLWVCSGVQAGFIMLSKHANGTSPTTSVVSSLCVKSGLSVGLLYFSPSLRCLAFHLIRELSTEQRNGNGGYDLYYPVARIIKVCQ
jgi:hypothetical protein